ncbi:UDP-forming cellulose synthase catalytic subunit [Stutzerimonas tarimensis]|uniref:Cellulose synthase catalytic subunit [UDP-forming] n=1 Tax=Stutzerimonas tarimensis TaxID=1507735 RepID=A0ABV7TB97_9GAMM
MTHPRALSASTRLAACASLLAACPAFLLFVVVPLSVPMQLLLGGSMIVLMLLLNNNRKSFGVTLVLVTLSLAVSTRYLYWRTTETLVFGNGLEATLGIGLYLAELYAYVILLLGYFQSILPLRRRIEPLPAAVSQWPTVDVYVPTYNESLDVVQDTVLAALDLDYPADKLRVYLLDDGRRPEFKAFAEAAGAGYITRSDNNHAKAGNLNNALKQTDGELICIFDCDHIGTRAFLQSTVGLFLKDRKLALVQTPHHFYSPDPFERNLASGKEVPNEGELFYGPVQQGNDYWNATFFCGSCAIIRRKALEQTDGFAVETVTEDAHTALKLQRKGWNTAFIAAPLAAGLATERLSLHIGQRMRWARGMTQIFRRDNPLLGRGLKLPQRLCYLNAMMHFQFPLPRIVFLTAPMAFLLLGQNIIASSAAAILSYALPHLVHAIITNARIQGRHRYSFWGEIYETALAFHLVLPTLVTLFAPKRGKFNVTDKGGLLDRNFFDHRMVRPHLLVIALLVLAIIVGLVRHYWVEGMPFGSDVLVINILWACFSLVTLFAAVAVAKEKRQVRTATRLPLRMPATLYLANGHTLQGTTQDVSMAGLNIVATAGEAEVLGQIEDVELTGWNGRSTLLPVEFTGAADGQIRVRFLPLTIAQRRTLVRLVMGRADAWLRQGPIEPDRPLLSLFGVFRNAAGLFRSPRRKPAVRQPAAQPAGPVLSPANLGLLPALQRGRAVPTLLGLLFLLGGCLAWSSGVLAEEAAAPAKPAVVSPQIEFLQFNQMGMSGRLTLRGARAEAGLPFSIRRQQVVTEAQLFLHLEHPAHLPAGAQLELLLNGEALSTLELASDTAVNTLVQVPVDPRLLLPRNRLNLRLASAAARCDDPENSDLWVTIGSDSALSLALDRLQMHNDLAILPAPFFDEGQMSPLVLPMVMPAQPGEGVLRSAVVVASYYGSMARQVGADFPVLLDELPPGNAIVFLQGEEPVAGIAPPESATASLAIISNPSDPLGKLLLVSGGTPEELYIAAANLVMNESGLRGQRLEVGRLEPTPRHPYDAPNWIANGRPVHFHEMADQPLSSDSLTPPTMSISFHAAPDTFAWNGANIPMKLHYSFPDAPWIDASRSRLDIALNGRYLTSLPVLKQGVVEKIRNQLGEQTRQVEAEIEIPSNLIVGDNRLDFFFNIKQPEGADCHFIPAAPTISMIDEGSYIDFSETKHFTQLPNLPLFARSGFPYTRMADLSETAVLLPATPSLSEIQAMLNMLGRFGKTTGYPALGVEVLTGETRLADVSGRDLLVISHLDSALALPDMLGGMPLRLEGEGLQVASPPPAELARTMILLGDWNYQLDEASRYLSGNPEFRGLVGRQSPYDPTRVMVMALASDEQWLPRMIASLEHPRVQANIRGDLAFFESEERVHGFRIGALFAQGELPWAIYVRWLLSERPLLLMTLLLTSTLLIAAGLYPLLREHAARRLS